MTQAKHKKEPPDNIEVILRFFLIFKNAHVNGFDKKSDCIILRKYSKCTNWPQLQFSKEHNNWISAQRWYYWI